MPNKIGIVGVGMVGGALKNYFEKKNGFELFLYDKGKNLGSMEEINKADIVFVCVPTPYKEESGSVRQSPEGSRPMTGGGFDLSYVKETCQELKGNKTIIIKSTVLPGTTEKLQKEFSQHKFLFNPEFLVEAKAEETMEKPDRQIMGYTEESESIAQKIMDFLPDAPYKKTISSTEAEMVKYFGNTFLSVKVIFGNQLYEICQKLKIDYEIVREATSKDPRIGPSHLDVFHGGYRGYGGKCLPKDTRALIQLAESVKAEIELLKKAEEINNELMKEQGIDDPEKYSERNPY